MEKTNEEYIKLSNDYTDTHRQNIITAFNMLLPKLISNNILSKQEISEIKSNLKIHDLSKYQVEEALPYGKFFFGERNDEVIAGFKRAVKLHKGRNPHHPEYFAKENKPITMPNVYIVEMVCDWWTFGIKDNNLAEIFDFYKEKKEKFNFSQDTAKKVEILLGLIKEVIEEKQIAKQINV